MAGGSHEREIEVGSEAAAWKSTGALEGAVEMKLLERDPYDPSLFQCIHIHVYEKLTCFIHSDYNVCCRSFTNRSEGNDAEIVGVVGMQRTNGSLCVSNSVLRHIPSVQFNDADSVSLDYAVDLIRWWWIPCEVDMSGV